MNDQSNTSADEVTEAMREAAKQREAACPECLGTGTAGDCGPGSVGSDEFGPCDCKTRKR